MSKYQYIVAISNLIEREKFYNYIVKNFNLKTKVSKENMINNKFPFIVDFNTHTFWITNSITCLACASQNNRIINKETFYQAIKNDLHK